MTQEEIEQVAKLVLAAQRNNIRCVRCGWIGPEDKLYASGSIGRLTCLQCHDGYHWDRAAPGRWFLKTKKRWWEL